MISDLRLVSRLTCVYRFTEVFKCFEHPSLPGRLLICSFAYLLIV